MFFCSKPIYPFLRFYFYGLNGRVIFDKQLLFFRDDFIDVFPFKARNFSEKRLLNSDAEYKRMKARNGKAKIFYLCFCRLIKGRREISQFDNIYNDFRILLCERSSAHTSKFHLKKNFISDLYSKTCVTFL